MFGKIFVIALCSFLVACHDQENSSQKIATTVVKDSISVRVVFPDHKTSTPINLLYLDEKNENRSIEATPADSTSLNFTLISKTPIFLLDWSENQTYFILYPSDELTIRPTGNENNSIKVESNTQIRNNELAFFTQLNEMELGLLRSKMNDNQLSKSSLFLANLKKRRLENISEASEIFKREYQERLAFLKQYADKYAISNNFKNVVQQYFKYRRSADVLLNLNNPKIKANRANVSLDSLLQFKNEDFNCDSCLYIPTYQTTIENYASYLYDLNKLSTVEEKFSFSKNHFFGRTREFVLFLLLKKNINTTSVAIDTTLFSDFKTLNTNKKYEEHLTENIMFRKTMRKSDAAKNTLLTDYLNQSVSLKDILNKYEGKLILLDFWASWCKPCIAEMPYSKKLHQRLEAENVVFLYFSVDEDPSSWKEAQTRLSLDKSNSYLLGKNYELLLKKKLDITSIPRYILLDINGSIITDEAPRPSNPDLETLIRSKLRS